MTEADWLACKDTKPMLELLGEKVSGRKLCHFAASCCRSIWGQMRKRSQRNVEVTERYFEGRATEKVLDKATAEATAAFEAAPENSIKHYITLAASLVAVNDVEEADCVAYSVAKVIAHQAMYSDDSIESTDETEAAYAARVLFEQDRQCRLLRCIIGNPFQAVTPDHAWLTHPVLVVAQAAYDERILPCGELDGERLAVLADAMEEAGCSDQAILDHLRSPGPHVRGCWALDIALAKV